MNTNKINDINPYVVSGWFFPIDSLLPSNELFPLRYTDWYELELITDSYGGYTIDNGIRYDLNKGDVLIRIPGTVTQGHPQYQCYIINFDLYYSPENVFIYNELNSIKNPLKYNTQKELFKNSDRSQEFPLQIPHKVNIKQYAKIEEYCSRICQEISRNDTRDDLLIKTYLLTIFLLVSKEWVMTGKISEPANTKSTNMSKISKIKNHIDNNPLAKYSLKYFSEITGLPDYTICRLSKKYYNVSIVDYINGCKLKHARILLTNTDMSVKEISIECGFGDYTYFFDVFKKAFTQSPLSYRKEHRLELE